MTTYTYSPLFNFYRPGGINDSDQILASTNFLTANVIQINNDGSATVGAALPNEGFFTFGTNINDLGRAVGYTDASFHAPYSSFLKNPDGSYTILNDQATSAPTPPPTTTPPKT